MVLYFCQYLISQSNINAITDYLFTTCLSFDNQICIHDDTATANIYPIRLLSVLSELVAAIISS